MERYLEGYDKKKRHLYNNLELVYGLKLFYDIVLYTPFKAIKLQM